MPHRDDVRMVILGHDGKWMAAKVGDVTLTGEQAREAQREVESRGGLTRDTVLSMAQNDPLVPPPSAEFPWLPGRRKRRKRRA